MEALYQECYKNCIYIESITFYVKTTFFRYMDGKCPPSYIFLTPKTLGSLLLSFSGQYNALPASGTPLACALPLLLCRCSIRNTSV